MASGDFCFFAYGRAGSSLLRWALSGCGKWALPSSCGLLTAVASLVAEHGLCGMWASVAAIPGL